MPRRPTTRPRVRRRPGGLPRERADRRALRRVAATLCLLLAFYCLIAATARLHAQTVPDPTASKTPEGPRRQMPLLIPLLFLVFVVVVAATVVRRRSRRRPGRRSGDGQAPPADSVPPSRAAGRR